MTNLITEDFALATFIKPCCSLPNNLLVESYIQGSKTIVDAVLDKEIAFDSIRINPSSFQNVELFDIEEFINESIINRVKKVYDMALLVAKEHRFFNIKTKQVAELQEGINRLVRVDHFYPEMQPATIYRAEYVLSLYR